MSQLRIGVAVLTMGTRPAELAALLESVAGQDVPPARTVVVGNGTPLPELADADGFVRRLGRFEYGRARG